MPPDDYAILYLPPPTFIAPLHFSSKPVSFLFFLFFFTTTRKNAWKLASHGSSWFRQSSRKICFHQTESGPNNKKKKYFAIVILEHNERTAKIYDPLDMTKTRRTTSPSLRDASFWFCFVFFPQYTLQFEFLQRNRRTMIYDRTGVERVPDDFNFSFELAVWLARGEGATCESFAIEFAPARKEKEF